MIDESKRLGTISGVNTSTIHAIFDEEVFRNLDLSTDQTGKIGSYVIMEDDLRSIIGSISALETIEPPAGSDYNGGGSPRHQMQIQMLGTLQEGQFTRGVFSFPKLGSGVYSTTPEDISSIFSTFREHDFSLGTISQFEQERLFLNPNKLFAKHIALFGSTGSGKSCTTASILQKVDWLENTHVVLLDLHGEYTPAFSGSGNIVKITELELPYWLMNFDEISEMFIDDNEHSAHNQMMVLKDAIMDSKRGKNLALKDYLTVDTPVSFDFIEVMARMRALDTERTLAGKEGPFFGQFTRFLVRLESKLTDRRYEFLFKPKLYKSSESLESWLTRLFALDTGHHITVLDLSRVPFDVINVLVSLLGRIIFDFNLWNPARQDFPILIVFEEAHTYLSMTGKSTAARKTVERIAKEGRKYGVSAMIVSQRPSEISETITAQCNNFIAMRLLNPNDQNYVRNLVPDSMANLVDILPTLQQGEAVVIGDSVAVPVRAMIDLASPAPAGADIKFFEKWERKDSTTDVPHVVDNWWKQIRI
ncbi:MAG TPA: ATP-binding protein [Bacteroidota bacterium]|nr:ATP-binding protein [Bacteroidota bacterium]